MENNYPPNIELLRSVIDDAPLPIGIYQGHDLSIILANKYMISTYGKGEDVIGKSYMEILPELKGQGIFEQLLEVLATGKPFTAVDQKVDIITGGELRTFYFNYNLTPVYNSQGIIYAVMNTALDVTNLNRAQKQASEAKQKLELAVQSADLGIFEAGQVNDQVITSGRFEQIWGVEPVGIHSHEELIGRVYLLDKEIREHAYQIAQETGWNCN